MSFGAAVAGAHMARRVGALVSADERQRSRAISEATTDSISVDELQRLEHLFAAADEDGGGDLDEDEFLEGFQDILGASMSPHALRQLFMRVDANSDGSVDWEEFTAWPRHRERKVGHRCTRRVALGLRSARRRRQPRCVCCC